MYIEIFSQCFFILVSWQVAWENVISTNKNYVPFIIIHNNKRFYTITIMSLEYSLIPSSRLEYLNNHRKPLNAFWLEKV